jgi:hypothetical protein
MKLTEQQIDRQLIHYEFIANLQNDTDMTQDCWRHDYENRFNYALKQNDPDYIDWFFRDFENEMEAAE